MDRDTGHQSIAAYKCQGLEPRTREKKAIIEIFHGNGTNFFFVSFLIIVCWYSAATYCWNDWSFLAFIEAVKWRRWWRWNLAVKLHNWLKQSQITIQMHSSSVSRMTQYWFTYHLSIRKGEAPDAKCIAKWTIYKVQFSALVMVRDAMRFYGSLLYEKFSLVN